MPKQGKLEKLQRIDNSLQRLHRRLIRTTNAIAKLSAQRKRLLKAKPLEKLIPPVPAEVPFNDPVPTFKKPEVSDVTDIPVTELPIPDKLDIPTFLRRDKKLDPAAQAIKDEQEERAKKKKVGGDARRKAFRTGEAKKMPLQGKAALAAIRGEA